MRDKGRVTRTRLRGQTRALPPCLMTSLCSLIGCLLANSTAFWVKNANFLFLAPDWSRAIFNEMHRAVIGYTPNGPPILLWRL